MRAQEARKPAIKQASKKEGSRGLSGYDLIGDSWEERALQPDGNTTANASSSVVSLGEKGRVRRKWCNFARTLLNIGFLSPFGTRERCQIRTAYGS